MNKYATLSTKTSARPPTRPSMRSNVLQSMSRFATQSRSSNATRCRSSSAEQSRTPSTSRSATPSTMRSARALSPPMEGPAADPAADLVDRDAKASEEALVELLMDMAQLLLLLVARSPGKSATMLQDKFQDRNAQTYQGRNVRMCP